MCVCVADYHWTAALFSGLPSTRCQGRRDTPPPRALGLPVGGREAPEATAVQAEPLPVVEDAQQPGGPPDGHFGQPLSLSPAENLLGLKALLFEQEAQELASRLDLAPLDPVRHVARQRCELGGDGGADREDRGGAAVADELHRHRLGPVAKAVLVGPEEAPPGRPLLLHRFEDGARHGAPLPRPRTDVRGVFAGVARGDDGGAGALGQGGGGFELVPHRLAVVLVYLFVEV